MVVASPSLIDPSRILVLGDTHGNWCWTVAVIEHAAANGVDTIVQAGDFGHWIPGSGTKFFLEKIHKALVEFGITLYWVDGNHECHPDIQERLNGSREAQALYKKYPRIIHLPRGFRWEWWGQTWMALGGAASVDRLQRKAGHDWFVGELLTTEDVEYASRPGDVDIIVSHDAPYGVDIPGIGIGIPNTDSGFPYACLIESGEHRRLVRDVVDAVRPSYIFHGHYHLRYQAFYELPGGGRVLVNGLDCDGSSMPRGSILLNRPE